MNNYSEEVKADNALNIAGTSLMGNITVPYKDLVSRFGDPSAIDGDGYKSDCEWIISTPDGVATIYNWKNGKNYLGKDGLKVEDISNWNIGGYNMKTVVWIMRALNIKMV